MNNSKARYAEGKRITWIAILANSLLAVIKLTTGLLGSSQALIADAVHSLSDLFTDAVVLAGLKFAEKPIDDSHPYGHGRVETVGAGVLGVILIFTGLGIGWEAITTIGEGVRTIPTALALAGAAVSIITKEILFRYTIRIGQKTGSSALIANAWHHRSDAFSSIATLFGIGAAMAGWPLFDPLAALIVTLLIIHVGWTILKDAFFDIIDTAVKPEIRNEIVTAALSIPGADAYHDLKTRKIGSDILVDIHIEVSPRMNVCEAHNIADEVKDAIVSNVVNIADVLVHIDPKEGGNEIACSSEEEEIIRKVKNLAESAAGISGCGEIRLCQRGENIVLNMTATLFPSMTIKEGYHIIATLKKEILKIEGIDDAVIGIEPTKEENTKK